MSELWGHICGSLRRNGFGSNKPAFEQGRCEKAAGEDRKHSFLSGKTYISAIEGGFSPGKGAEWFAPEGIG